MGNEIYKREKSEGVNFGATTMIRSMTAQARRSTHYDKKAKVAEEPRPKS